MRERNGERFYETADVNMDKVHEAMTEAGRRERALPLEMLGHNGWRRAREQDANLPPQ